MDIKSHLVYGMDGSKKTLEVKPNLAMVEYIKSMDTDIPEKLSDPKQDERQTIFNILSY